MRTLQLKTDGQLVANAKQIILAVSLLFTFLPFFVIYWSDSNVAPEIKNILINMLCTGISLLTIYCTVMILLSTYSPFKLLGVRKKTYPVYKATY